MIECCSNIFPSQPYRGLAEINCGLQTNKVDDWNVWYSQHWTDLSLAGYWLVSSVLASSLSQVSQLSSIH